MLIHLPEHLAAYVRTHRKSQGLTQSAVGRSANLKQATISEFENKPEGSKIETLFKILAATNIEIHLIPRGADLVIKDTQDEGW